MFEIKRYDRCDSRDIDIEYMIKLIEKDVFILPDSQREKEWVFEQDVNFIKSIFENKPIGSIVLNKKSDKYFILDGQHRIDSIKKFYLNEFKLLEYSFNELDEDWKKIFLETKIYIKEYYNLSDKDMKNIIHSINEGIKNDNIIKNDDTINIIQNFYHDVSIIIYNKCYKDLKSTEKDNIKKYIGYIGTIINNINNYKSNSDYKLLSIKHSVRHQNYMNMLELHNLEIHIKNLTKFIKFIFENKIINIEDDINNNIINMILYKCFPLINSDKNINDIKNKINTIIENNSKNKFRELLDIFDNVH
jgi:hypothetical protein